MLLVMSKHFVRRNILSSNSEAYASEFLEEKSSSLLVEVNESCMHKWLHASNHTNFPTPGK